MKENIKYPTEEELNKMNPEVLEDYLNKLVSIDEGLKEYINEKSEEENNE